MALPPIRGTVHPAIKPSNMNWWATYQFWRGAPLIADDWFLALQGAGVRWDVCALYQWMRTNFGRNEMKDPFGIGFEGSPEDTVVNASVRVTELASVDELPGDQVFWQSFELTWIRWQSFCDSLIKRQEEGEPIPQPTPPAPPKPVPPPPEPPKPQPEQPKPEPVPTPAPNQPRPPFKLPGWLKLAFTFSAGLIAGSLDKILDAWIGPGEYDKIIREIISAITAQVG